MKTNSPIILTPVPRYANDSLTKASQSEALKFWVLLAFKYNLTPPLIKAILSLKKEFRIDDENRMVITNRRK